MSTADLDEDFYSEEQEEEGIFFHSESTDFFLEPASEEKYISWIVEIVENHQASLQLLNIIFCSDDYLYQMNVDYLGHDTYTDIITFPYSDPSTEPLSGDLFISVDRVRENAVAFLVGFEEELSRVMIHGVLHLLGFGDKTPEEAALMREKENASLRLLSRT